MKAKEYWRLYRLVCKTKDLGEKRHIMFEQNKAMKWLGYLFAAFWCFFLTFAADSREEFPHSTLNFKH